MKVDSASSASTIIKRAPTQASMAYSQALTTVTAISNPRTQALEPDSILAGPSTAGPGTLKSRAKMDMINKSRGSGIGSRSGIYSTIGRNAQMPEETPLAKSSRSLAKSQHSSNPAESQPGSNSRSQPGSSFGTKSIPPIRMF